VAGLVRAIDQGGEEPYMGCAAPPRRGAAHRGLLRVKNVSTTWLVVARW